MGAGSDNEPLASPGNFFLGRKGRVAELFAEFLGRSFLSLPHFATVDHHIMRVALSLDLDLTKFDQSCFHISMFPCLKLQGKRRVLRACSPAIETSSWRRPNEHRKHHTSREGKIRAAALLVQQGRGNACG